MAFIGIVASLVIPNILTTAKEGELRKELNQSIQNLLDIASSTELSISQSDIPEENRELILGHLKMVKEEAQGMAIPRSKVMAAPMSIGDLKAQIASVEFLADEIKKPDTLIAKGASRDPDLAVPPSQTVERRLITLEVEMKILMEERLTEWKVAQVLLVIVMALTGLAALFKYSSQKPPKSAMRRK